MPKEMSIRYRFFKDFLPISVEKLQKVIQRNVLPIQTSLNFCKSIFYTVSKRDYCNRSVLPPAQNQPISLLICALKLQLAVEITLYLERNPCWAERLQVTENQAHSPR